MNLQDLQFELIVILCKWGCIFFDLLCSYFVDFNNWPGKFVKILNALFEIFISLLEFSWELLGHDLKGEFSFLVLIYGLL